MNKWTISPAPTFFCHRVQTTNIARQKVFLFLWVMIEPEIPNNKYTCTIEVNIVRRHSTKTKTPSHHNTANHQRQSRPRDEKSKNKNKWKQLQPLRVPILSETYSVSVVALATAVFQFSILSYIHKFENGKCSLSAMSSVLSSYIDGITYKTWFVKRISHPNGWGRRDIGSKT